MTGAHADEVWPLVVAHHYSARRTADPMHCFAWRLPGGLLGDTGMPCAAIIYTAPINRVFTDATELSRLVRVPEFDQQLSEFVAWSLRWLKRNTDLRYCLSYADPSAGHHGGIYQALNFLYLGLSAGNRRYRNPATGEVVSGRSFDQRRPAYREGWVSEKTAKKHLYVYPLSDSRRQLSARFPDRLQPYPKPNLWGDPPDDRTAPSTITATDPVPRDRG